MGKDVKGCHRRFAPAEAGGKLKSWLDKSSSGTAFNSGIKL
jgi:hypothetical protein